MYSEMGCLSLSKEERRPSGREKEKNRGGVRCNDKGNGVLRRQEGGKVKSTQNQKGDQKGVIGRGVQ